MSRAVFFSGLLATLMPVAALALEVRIDPHADLLYRQALPLLEQADAENDSASPLRTADLRDPELSRQGARYRARSHCWRSQSNWVIRLPSTAWRCIT